jgi:lysophospholipase L1-like esterase
VPLVAKGLGVSELINLGVPGDTSADLLAGPLDEGIAEIQQRRSDGIPGNEVSVITLEIGGNDLLNLYFDLVVPGVCPNLAEGLANPKCTAGLQAALDEYRPNLHQALARLKEAAPDVPLFLLTIYNPFSGGSQNIDEVAKLALEGEPGTPFPEGLNDIIRDEAKAAGVHLVDIYPLFLGKASQYIYRDLVHPNDAGYKVMAGAVLEAMRAAGLP